MLSVSMAIPTMVVIRRERVARILDMPCRMFVGNGRVPILCYHHLCGSSRPNMTNPPVGIMPRGFLRTHAIAVWRGRGLVHQSISIAPIIWFRIIPTVLHVTGSHFIIPGLTKNVQGAYRGSRTLTLECLSGPTHLGFEFEQASPKDPILPDAPALMCRAC